MKPYISKVEIKNYRSCNRTSVELNQGLSTLIGINGSGKSNFLKGLLLLKKMTSPRPHYSNDEENANSLCKINGTFVIENKNLPFQSEIRYSTSEHNVDVVIEANQTWDFNEFIGNTGQIKIPISLFFELKEFQRFSLSSKKGYSLSDREHRKTLLFKRFGIFSGKNSKLTSEQFMIIERIMEQVNDFLTGISYYSASQFTDPSKCQTYFEIEDERAFSRYDRDWNVHQKFMFDLYQVYKRNPKKFKEFLSIIGYEGLGLVDTIKYDELQVPINKYEVGIGGKVFSKEYSKRLIIPNFHIHSLSLSPNQLSEGTFKTLAIIFYLVTDTSNLLLIEEPEVCVHHGLLDSLMELIKGFAYEKQIIISTHSDFVLDELKPENVFIVRNDFEKGTLIKHVPDALSKRDYKALKDYLEQSGNLGEYWRHGELEK